MSTVHRTESALEALHLCRLLIAKHPTCRELHDLLAEIEAMLAEFAAHEGVDVRILGDGGLAQ